MARVLNEWRRGSDGVRDGTKNILFQLNTRLAEKRESGPLMVYTIAEYPYEKEINLSR